MCYTMPMNSIRELLDNTPSSNGIQRIIVPKRLGAEREVLSRNFDANL